MAHRIYTLTTTAKDAGWDWDEIIARGEIETVEEFETYEEAVEVYENQGLDTDLYGVE